MNPSINPTFVKVFKLSDTATPHSFRNRPDDREGSYEFLKEVKIQAVWFSHQKLEYRDSVDRLRSLGYFIFRNIDLKRLGIDPAPNGGNWARYRFSPKINDTYSSKLLCVVEMRPESPWRGQFRLWYAYFDEVRPAHKMDDTETPVEEPGDAFKDVDEVVEVIVEHA